MAGNVHLQAQLLADMLELLMVLLPDEHCDFLDTRDTEIFALEVVGSYYRGPKGRKGAP